MTTAERKLAAALLRLASDQFSNHGCNDFNLAEYITDPGERDSLVLEACGELYGEGSDPDYRLPDSVLMDLMADRLEANEPEGGWCSQCGQAGHTDEDPHVRRIYGRRVGAPEWTGQRAER